MKTARIPPELLDGPFTVATAKAHGVTRSMLLGPAWRTMHRGVHVASRLPDTRALRAAGVALIIDPDAFLCGASAAWLLGIDVQLSSRDVPLLSVASINGRRLRRRAGWKVYEITPEEGDIVCIEGIRVTSPLRTAFDCARWLPRDQAVMVIDSLTHRQLTTPVEIVEYASRQFHVRNVRRVPRILELVEPLTESPQETRLRLMMVDDGLTPEAQFRVFAGDVEIARLDFAFPAKKIAVEYDGEWHSERVAADERRRARLEDLGWKVIKIYAEDLRTPAARLRTMARIRAAVAAR